MRGLWANLAAALGAALLFTSAPALAQGGAIQQSGPVTPFHAGVWFSNGVLADGGTPTTPFLNSLGLFGGSSCPFGISSQSGPGANTSPGGLFTICQTATTTTFNFAGVNGSGAPNVYFNIGGALFPFPQAYPSISAYAIAATNLTAPALVNISSAFQVQYANAATGLPANGYITASVTSGNLGLVFYAGLLSGLSGLTGGNVFLSASSPGGVTSTPPSGSGQYVQAVGVALSSGSIIFIPGAMNGPL